LNYLPDAYFIIIRNKRICFTAEPKGKGKPVSFDLPDTSEGVPHTNSVMDDFSSFCDDLYNVPQKTAEKVCQREQPFDHADEQQLKSHVGERGSSMKIRSREKLQKVGICQQNTEDFSGEEFVEPSTSEQDNDSTVDYTAGSKRKNERRSRYSEEEPQQQGVQIDKSQVSSGQKKISKDAPTEKN
jgi:hypothetical protein